jgi:hypothetical protein
MMFGTSARRGLGHADEDRAREDRADDKYAFWSMRLGRERLRRPGFVCVSFAVYSIGCPSSRRQR